MGDSFSMKSENMGWLSGCRVFGRMDGRFHQEEHASIYHFCLDGQIRNMSLWKSSWTLRFSKWCGFFASGDVAIFTEFAARNFSDTWRTPSDGALAN